MRLLAPESLVSRLMLLQFQNGLSPGSTTGLSGPWVMMRRMLTVGCAKVSQSEVTVRTSAHSDLKL